MPYRLRPAQFTPGRKYRATRLGQGQPSDAAPRGAATAVATLATRVTRPTTTHPTWSDQHDVEGRPVRLVVHADIFTQVAAGRVSRGRSCSL